jgi:UDP-glucuronate decarboxylase
LSEIKKFENSTILITGACGFIGYYLLRFFQNRRTELKIKKIIALDNFMLGLPAWLSDIKSDSGFEVYRFDVISDRIEEINGAGDADYVIHMASIASPVYYRMHPIETLDANVWGLRKLLEFYKNKPILGFLFLSSSEIYGDPDARHIPTSENYRGNVSPTGPRSCYDESKRFCETMCMLFGQKHGMPIGVARPFNNYGPGMKITDKRVPADFAQAIFENNNIEIFSTGAPTRTFCYIADAAAGYLKTLLHGEYDCFNIGIEKPEISIAELAEIYTSVGRDLFGYNGKVTYAVSDDTAYLTDNPARRCPDIGKARDILGYNPQIEVNEGVRRFLDFIKTSGAVDFQW